MEFDSLFNDPEAEESSVPTDSEEEEEEEWEDIEEEEEEEEEKYEEEKEDEEDKMKRRVKEEERAYHDSFVRRQQLRARSVAPGCELLGTSHAPISSPISEGLTYRNFESPSSYSTAVSQNQSFHTPMSGTHVKPVGRNTQWRQFLELKKLIPDAFDEQNWSGRGQHAEYTASERHWIPLVQENVILGHSSYAIVDSVRCRRIRLARKRIKCGRHLRREDAIEEVAHLQRLSHSHVLRVVGTYTFQDELSILLYPVANWDLEKFMDAALEDAPDRLPHPSCESCTPQWEGTVRGVRNSPFVQSRKIAHILRFFGCLANTVEYLHKKIIKHMDIKPKNILVKQKAQACCDTPYFDIFIADFGISRSYPSIQDSFTDQPTSFTRLYSAPEVVAQDNRGLSADIFSLGCVFTEMLALLVSHFTTTDELGALHDLRSANLDNDRSYQANIERVTNYLVELKKNEDNEWFHEACIVAASMLDENPEQRPSAQYLAEHFTALGCCSRGAPSFVVD